MVLPGQRISAVAAPRIWPARRSSSRHLPRSRMPAAGIRPLPGRVVLPLSPLLDEAFALRIEHENRKRAVQQAVLMDAPLVAVAQPQVVFVDQDDLFKFVAHAARLQLTR